MTLLQIFSTIEIKDHLIVGTSDEELMSTYGLSPEELKALYEQFVRAMSLGLSVFSCGETIDSLGDVYCNRQIERNG